MDRKEKQLGNLVWIDLEMTGLDLKKDTILEIATIVTNNDLDIIAQGPHFVIKHTQEQLDAMNQWNKEHHTASGLVEAALSSSITVEYAQKETLEFVSCYTKKKQAPLCGNSVWQDRRFLDLYMPELDNFLNYRIIDVSSIKEIIRRWYPNSLHIYFAKSDDHRALADITQSVEELKHYRKYFFIA